MKDITQVKNINPKNPENNNTPLSKGKNRRNKTERYFRNVG